MEGTFVHCMIVETRKQRITLFQVIWECTLTLDGKVHKTWLRPLISENAWESAINIDFGVYK